MNPPLRTPRRHPIDPRWAWHHRALLLARRRLAREVADHTQAAGDSEAAVGDAGDRAGEELERVISAALAGGEERTLAEIDEALRRIEAGTYGICQATGRPIPAERLRAIPWCRYVAEEEAAREREGSVRPPAPADQGGNFMEEASFGGREALIRSLRPGDAGLLLGFFATHTPETIRDRYGYTIKQLSPKRASELVGIDQAWDAALGVFEGAPPGEQLIAVARCCRLPVLNAAEIAFVVREDRRRLGIATALFERLAALMRARGVNRLVAQVDASNEAMLELFRKEGARLAPIPGTTAILASMALAQKRTG